MLGKLEEYIGFDNMRTRGRIEWCVCVFIHFDYDN